MATVTLAEYAKQHPLDEKHFQETIRKVTEPMFRHFGCLAETGGVLSFDRLGLKSEFEIQQAHNMLEGIDFWIAHSGKKICRKEDAFHIQYWGDFYKLDCERALDYLLNHHSHFLFALEHFASFLNSAVVANADEEGSLKVFQAHNEDFVQRVKNALDNRNGGLFLLRIFNYVKPVAYVLGCRHVVKDIGYTDGYWNCITFKANIETE